MDRPAIPSKIKRDVLVEAGHRCAIPTCGYTQVELHHIIPWEICKRHDFDNLIALCPNCHRRADLGEIDRKALRIYKTRLSATFGVQSHTEEQIQASITESVIGNPGYEFDFEYPIFEEADLKPVSHALQSWSNELLQRHRASHLLDPTEEPDVGVMYGKNTTSASFDVVRQDGCLLSIRYSLNRYSCGAAHGHSTTVTFNYWRNPLFAIRLSDIFRTPDSLQSLAALCRDMLLKDSDKDREWVERGTMPDIRNFSRFNFTDSTLVFTFDAYQVDSFSAGPQFVELSREQVTDIVRPFFLRCMGPW